MNLDLCKTTLVTSYILLQREQQSLSVLGGQYYAALDIGLLQARECRGKVDDKLRGRVRNDSQVGVVSLGLIISTWFFVNRCISA